MMRNFIRILIILNIAGAAINFLATGAFAAQVKGDSSAVAYQINVGHSGYADFQKTKFSPPFKILWSVNLDSTISYPLIAGGRVYVTAENTNGYGTRLFSFDEHTGRQIGKAVQIPGTYGFSAAAYDKGSIFVVNFDGLVRAFDAKTLKQLWSAQMPGQYAFTAPPTASNGIVYVGGAGVGGTVYAVDETTGALIWQETVENGDKSSPAIGDGNIFVSYPCQAYAFAALTGAPSWHYSGPCEGGGGKTSVYFGGQLYVRDPVSSPAGTIFNAKNGKIIDHFSGIATVPAFAGANIFYRTGNNLMAVNRGSKKILWSFAGDGQISSAPIAVNKLVFVGSTSGKLYALNQSNGQVLQTIQLQGAISAPDEQNAVVLTGMAAGDGLLVAPAGTTLFAISKK